MHISSISSPRNKLAVLAEAERRIVTVDGVRTLTNRAERRAIAKLQGKSAKDRDLDDSPSFDLAHLDLICREKAAYAIAVSRFEAKDVRTLKGLALADAASQRVAFAAKLAEEGGLKPVIVSPLDGAALTAAVAGKSEERQRRILNAVKAVIEAVGVDAATSLDLKKVVEKAEQAGLKPRRARDGVLGLKLYRKLTQAPAPRKIRVLTLFDGIGAAAVAAELLGDRFEIVASAEILPHPSAVAALRHPKTVNLGNVKTEDWKKFKERYGEIDLIIFGWPCQDISRANQDQLGLKGARSSLFFTVMEIVRILNPKYLLGENVAALFDGNMREDLKTVFAEVEKVGKGYRVDADLLDPTQFDSPMARPRFYMFGARKDVAAKLPKLKAHRNPIAARVLKEIGKDRFGGYLSALRVAKPSYLGDYLVPNPDPSLLYKDTNRAAAMDKWDRKDRVLAERLAFEPDHANRIPDITGMAPFAAHGINDTLCYWAQQFGLGGSGLKANKTYTFTRRVGFGVLYEGCARRYAVEEVEALFGFPQGYTDVPYVDGGRVKKPTYAVRMAALGNTMAVCCIKHALEAVLLAEYLAD